MKKLIIASFFSLLTVLPGCMTQNNLDPIMQAVNGVEQNYVEIADNFRTAVMTSTLPEGQKTAILLKIDGNARVTLDLLRGVRTALMEAGSVTSEQLNLLNQALDAWLAAEMANGGR